MPIEDDARTSLLRRVSGSAWLTIAILAASGLLVTWWLVDREPVATVPVAHQGVGDVSTTDEALGPSPEPRTDPHSLAVGVPTPTAVLADPQCRMVVGQRTASDTALVYLPLGQGAWFAVVNSFGVVFDGTLPFVPERPVVGKRPDGTILAGFSLEGEVQVVYDGSVIYEYDNVLRFDIADDGSSFFVVEPLAGDASRLVVRNLDLREEHHYGLGATVRSERELDFDLSYSIDFAEVIVQPSHGGGTSRFYPAVGGDPREVSIERRDAVPTTPGARPSDTSIFASSATSYHAHLMGPTLRGEFAYRWRIFKIEREFMAGVERREESWTRDVRFLFLTMHLSPDGAWLVLSDVFTGVVVLDATDGETVFSYPQERDRRLELWRFGRRFVNPEERFWGRFVGDRLFVSRWLDDKLDEGRNVEVYELDRFAKRARRVREFKVEQGADESEQTFAIRTTLDPDAALSCTDHALLDRRLEIRDDRLTYTAADY